MSHGRVTQASESAKINRTTHYAWLKTDKAYRQAFDKCRVWICFQIEEGLVDRLANGWDEPVFYEGSQCGVKRKFDNAACLRYLERVNREIFGDVGEQEIDPAEFRPHVANTIAAMMAMSGGPQGENIYDILKNNPKYRDEVRSTLEQIESETQ